MIPDLDRVRVERWLSACNAELSPSARQYLWYDLDLTDRTVTLVECRPARASAHETVANGDEIRSPICRFRYTKARSEWSLYWRDSNSRFHQYDEAAPTRHIQELIDHVEDDETGIFWG